ncbi:GNAT family N-acetyltransferase [Streptosporangium sp. NPDC020072]|uniref:GNAT family N-acetyltransferase n=1 Tax=Streptosporangium sp. NPDC020072 TaxID=3154788 RepID=UPI00342ED9D7
MPGSPRDPVGDPTVAAFFALHDDLARQGPGSDATTRHLLSLAGPPVPRPRVLDIGCGPGRSSLVPAQAGAEVTAVDLRQPYLDWFEEYRTPLSQRVHAADLAVPGMREAVAATLQEITMRREHGADYRYTGYVLHPQKDKETNPTMTSSWTTRPENAGDVAAIRDINLAAFPSPHEADLVEALRADPQAWLPGLSWLAEAPDGDLAGYALLTRCHVGDSPALTLGPCAVKPDHQRQGSGSAAIRAALRAAREQGENLVLVLGHAEYYPRFGFTPASGYGIRPPFDVEDKYMMALAFNPEQPVPSGVIRYPAAFGV